MGILKSKPNESKRQPGYGVLYFEPYFFVKPEEFVKELKDRFLPFLTKDEEEELIHQSADIGNNSRVFVLVPEKEYRSLESNKEELKTCIARVGASLNHNCWCSKLWEGCCSGVNLRGAERNNQEDMKQYFITGRD